MSDENKTAAEMLRELREDMTAGEWRKHVNREAEPEIYSSEDNWIAVLPHQCVASIEKQSHANARGIVALVNSLEEIAAVVEAGIEMGSWRGEDYREDFFDALSKLEEKLREHLKGAGDE